MCVWGWGCCCCAWNQPSRDLVGAVVGLAGGGGVGRESIVDKDTLEACGERGSVVLVVVVVLVVDALLLIVVSEDLDGPTPSPPPPPLCCLV